MGSFEERSAWVQLGSLLAVLGGYFVVAWRMLAQGITALPPYVPVFAVAVTFMVIVVVAGHVVATGSSSGAPRANPVGSSQLVFLPGLPGWWRPCPTSGWRICC